ncbi:MAG TPA: hypothetical protein VK666_26145, partial [Chryseolinea sp.]|nr:hypothetical protein [Chryseolinea sp.]
MDDMKWFSFDWFNQATLNTFSWENPAFLYAIIGVPLIFIVRWLIRYKFNQKLPVAVTAKDL